MILKRPNKRQKNSDEKTSAVKSIVSELRDSENIDGNIIHEKEYEKMRIGN